MAMVVLMGDEETMVSIEVQVQSLTVTVTVTVTVVLYDGHTETDIGSVAIYPDITVLKSFQMILSHKIGISAHQFTVYLSFKDHKRPNTRPKFCRRVPITAKTDFSSLLYSQATDSFFLVVLKRRRRNHNKFHNYYDADADADAEKMIVRDFNFGPIILGRQAMDFCQKCFRSPNEFHPCVNDAIVFSWFKSHAGPISPPIN
ncbi:hypothetical protein ACFE04_020955 [Oxalis oulophora]